jgi:hypothetical protein
VIASLSSLPGGLEPRAVLMTIVLGLAAVAIGPLIFGLFSGRGKF